MKPPHSLSLSVHINSCSQIWKGTRPTETYDRRFKNFVEHHVADAGFLRRAPGERLRPFLPRHMGPLRGLRPRHRSALRQGLGGGSRGECADRLEGDAGGTRVQGGPAGAEEGGGEGGGAGRAGTVDQRGEAEGAGGEDGQVAPRGAEQQAVRAVAQAAGERNVRLDGVRANMENGVLTVVVLKAEEKKSEVRAIDVAGGGPERERGE